MRKSLALLCLVASLSAAVNNPGAVAERLREKQRAEMTAAAMAWLRSADLADVPVPKLGDDPKESERKAEREAKEVNEYLCRLRQWRDRAASGDKEGEQAAYEWFRGIAATSPQIVDVCRVKGRQ